MAHHPVRPARPHHKLTDDGRPVREVLSYSRRGSRLSTTQQQAWDELAERWVIPDEAVEQDGFAWATWFGREAPLAVEIGGGIGEATAALAVLHPEWNILALEVWHPGVAEGLGRVAAAGASNVRFCSVDAVWTLEHLVTPGSLAELWTFFPDPWHKARHHKRRLVNAEFAHVAAQRLAPGAAWRLATDWADYAEQMLEVLDAEPLLAGGAVERWDGRPLTKFERAPLLAGGAVERWDGRPLTKFERKGLRVGRQIADLRYVRV